jgi:hypothetical protein
LEEIIEQRIYIKAEFDAEEISQLRQQYHFLVMQGASWLRRQAAGAG